MVPYRRVRPRLNSDHGREQFYCRKRARNYWRLTSGSSEGPGASQRPGLLDMHGPDLTGEARELACFALASIPCAAATLTALQHRAMSNSLSIRPITLGVAAVVEGPEFVCSDISSLGHFGSIVTKIPNDFMPACRAANFLATMNGCRTQAPSRRAACESATVCDEVWGAPAGFLFAVQKPAMDERSESE